MDLAKYLDFNDYFVFKDTLKSHFLFPETEPKSTNELTGKTCSTFN